MKSFVKRENGRRVVRGGGSGGLVVVFVLLLARRAKREGDRGFIHNFMMMVMMRFQEGTSTTTRTCDHG